MRKRLDKLVMDTGVRGGKACYTPGRPFRECTDTKFLCGTFAQGRFFEVFQSVVDVFYKSVAEGGP